jgi:hypothetical protein
LQLHASFVSLTFGSVSHVATILQTNNVKAETLWHYSTMLRCVLEILVDSRLNRPSLQALQTIALFGLKLNRFPAALGALIFFLLYEPFFDGIVSHVHRF